PALFAFFASRVYGTSFRRIIERCYERHPSSHSFANKQIVTEERIRTLCLPLFLKINKRMERFVTEHSNATRQSICQFVWKQFFLVRILERILPLFFVNGMMDVIFSTTTDKASNATWMNQKVE